MIRHLIKSGTVLLLVKADRFAKAICLKFLRNAIILM